MDKPITFVLCHDGTVICGRIWTSDNRGRRVISRKCRDLGEYAR